MLTAAAAVGAFGLVRVGMGQVAAIMLVGTLMSCTVGTVLAIVMDVIRPEFRATAAAFVALVGNVGMAAGPFLVGAMSDAWGLQTALTVAGAFPLDRRGAVRAGAAATARNPARAALDVAPAIGLHRTQPDRGVMPFTLSHSAPTIRGDAQRAGLWPLVRRAFAILLTLGLLGYGALAIEAGIGDLGVRESAHRKRPAGRARSRRARYRRGARPCKRALSDAEPGCEVRRVERYVYGRDGLLETLIHYAEMPGLTSRSW